MNKPCSITLAACLALTACNGSKQKSTWQKVRETKPDKVQASADPNEAYTRKLNKVLNENKVEHKVVTYQYRYKTRMREDAVGTHSAIIYKDNSDPENPWWLVNERTGKPIWLPGQDVNKQVSFYLRRKAEVTDEKVFSGGEPQSTETMVAKHTPPQPVVPDASADFTRIAKVKKQPAPRRAPAPTAAPTQTAIAKAAAPAETTQFLRPEQFQGAPNEVAIPFTKPTPVDGQLGDQFRRAHGTEYDPASPIDRRKMEALKEARLTPREPAPAQTF
jgi:hypothetical protein